MGGVLNICDKRLDCAVLSSETIMRGFDKLTNGEQRQIMSRPNKQAQGMTHTWLRTKRTFTGIVCLRSALSPAALRMSVRGTNDRLSWMHTHYYRKHTKPTTACRSCGQTLPRVQTLNTAGKRRLATMKRRTKKRQRKLLSPVSRPLSWIVTAERMAIEDVTYNRLLNLTGGSI